MLASRKNLLKKLTFDNNRYSPIVIYGKSGVGKSFFVRELCNRLHENGTATIILPNKLQRF